MIKENLLKGLTPEQIKKARACRDNSELLALAKEEGLELSDEQLKAVSGGTCQEREIKGRVCPNCDGTNTNGIYDGHLKNSGGAYACKCHDCGCEFIA